MKKRSTTTSIARIGTIFAIVLVATALTCPKEGRASEFCEVLNKFNADKKISDPETRARFEGEYGQSDDSERLRTWNVETVCEEFLVVVPLWADVSPPVLQKKGETTFVDFNGNTWSFQLGKDGRATAVAMVFALAAANPDGARENLTVFLMLAPLVPVAGLALAYGPVVGPMYEISVATPLSVYGRSQCRLLRNWPRRATSPEGERRSPQHFGPSAAPDNHDATTAQHPSEIRQ